ncbi:Spy/CpxP family protein refolding chaperone [Glaciimonas sp. PCH181]|uniref:Spy/CpxP family protein refolding chaperone n=1 Tax=Glaciimonas sp. PCH181 TaxID=2133943 RepID=UPI001374AC9C|nr:Spy/CpxP family protein refolding chaperone [Glaciimonas sp. PCH181]
MRKPIAAMYLLSGLFLAGAGVTAFAQGTQPATNSAAQSVHPQKDPTAATQKRLAELKQKLNLKPAQESAWETFSSSLTAQVTMQAQSKEKIRAAIAPGYDNLSTPEKMEKMAAILRSDADFLSKSAATTKTFYDGLSTEQKTIFDLFSKTVWSNRMKEKTR